MQTIQNSFIQLSEQAIRHVLTQPAALAFPGTEHYRDTSPDLTFVPPDLRPSSVHSGDANRKGGCHHPEQKCRRKAQSERCSPHQCRIFTNVGCSINAETSRGCRAEQKGKRKARSDRGADSGARGRKRSHMASPLPGGPVAGADVRLDRWPPSTDADGRELEDQVGSTLTFASSCILTFHSLTYSVVLYMFLGSLQMPLRVVSISR